MVFVPEIDSGKVFSISILLYDLFAFFSIYKILINSRCSAVHLFKVYPCVNFFIVLTIRFQK